MTHFQRLVMPPAEALPLTPEAVPEIPDNLFVLTSHGTARIPDFPRYLQTDSPSETAGELDPALPHNALRMDGSDVAVGVFGKYIAQLESDAAASPPLAARLFINPNGPRKDALEVREATFGDVPIWASKPSLEVQAEMTRQIWDTFHDRVQAGVETIALGTPPTDHMLIVDIHDTDEVVFGPDGKLRIEEPVEGYFGFPLLLVSNRDGQAAHSEVLSALGQSLFEHFIAEGLLDEQQARALGFKQNEPYKGGYTTQRYGVDLENAYLLRGNDQLRKKAQHMHFVQIELNKAMYVLPDRSGFDDERISRAQRAIAMALAETANAIRFIDFGNWREAPKPANDTEASHPYRDAMSLQLIAATETYAADNKRRAEPVREEFRDQDTYRAG